MTTIFSWRTEKKEAHQLRLDIWRRKKDVRQRRRERDKTPEAHNGTDEEGWKEEESVG